VARIAKLGDLLVDIKPHVLRPQLCKSRRRLRLQRADHRHLGWPQGAQHQQPARPFSADASTTMKLMNSNLDAHQAQPHLRDQHRDGLAVWDEFTVL
jgi:hypothetical protein